MRLLGITVLADFIQSEGVETVLDNIVRTGATAVATNPTVTAPGDAATGSWQPPSDAGASVRLFDRPLWGKRELWVRSAPSFWPNERYYRDTPYSPRRASDLTVSDGPIVAEFVRSARARGLKVFFQVGAVQPPGELRDEDVPRLPSGRYPRDRMAQTGSLASEAIRAYNRAYTRDLLEQYPEIDGLRLDWPEYPCYKLDEAFQDFGSPVKRWAEARGRDFEGIREEALRCYDYLHRELTNADLEELAADTPLPNGQARAAEGPGARIGLYLARFPALAEWLKLKAELSADLLRDWREALTLHGGAGKELSANAFMPPYNRVTGLDLGAASEICASVSVKLYTMHWALMVRFWGEALLRKNRGLDESLLVKALVNLMDLSDGEYGSTLSHYDYPDPDTPHPIPDGPQLRKLEQALAVVGGRARVNALVHGYGPPHDFRRRLELAARSRVDGVWINRYGYLSDEKLDVIRDVWSATG